ncbi:MAG TPA: response regulator transcription factor [Burkholderiaceae bacterium]|nr:response regulator transcription factor [Burkholderiaceae bacterium]
MLPAKLALIDDDAEYSDYLAQHLREMGVAVTAYRDANALLADPGAYGHDFYLVDLMMPGVDGVELIKILRLRTDSGILVVSGRLGAEAFNAVMTSGADMYLAKPVQFEQVVLAIKAVHRRAARSGVAEGIWRLDYRNRELIAPDSARVQLSEADVAVLDCFVQAHGEVVTREAIRQGLGKSGDHDDMALNATIYRLRRRIERATPLLVPLQSRSRVGYVFRATLTAV